MLALEEHNLKLLGAARQSHYVKNPPSNAVDGLVDTAFCSPECKPPLFLYCAMQKFDIPVLRRCTQRRHNFIRYALERSICGGFKCRIRLAG